MNKKLIIALSSFTLLGGMAIGAGAAPILEKITANLNWGINYNISGKAWSPVDQNGKKLAAITYNNTTYLPVRSVGEALGVAVDYNGSSQTLTLGEKSDTTPITSEKIVTDYSSYVTKDKQFTVQQEKDYISGVIMKQINSADKEFNIHTEGKYQKLEVSVFPVDVKTDISVRILDGDVLLKEIIFGSSDKIQTASFDIGAAKKLTIEADTLKVTGTDSSIFLTGDLK
ncbi:copper amine oxidase N-terminal domain-containing protein [Paenibacillus sp. LS1]|uniref:copper amine oxidase N-terminal domain-containing protein n=1 Tax=Paenibacillus sp. LS1 TaxID=2992120 RepID=UPI00222FF48D|nr:copper amine oxidase N-terminal domain-containing protein [Paenibacillus sp. LS1]MCW3795059.1 copper amine oxidase N-terminal domain-containing protein [Paenibacillus sp. LS1]